MVTFAGVVFLPGYYVYADEDGILVAERELVPIAYSNTSDEA
jgi:regulator of RNase E activity RraA